MPFAPPSAPGENHLAINVGIPNLFLKHSLEGAAADVEAATEAKPAPTLAIATDAKAAAQYSADVESWGERVQAASVRVCLWLNRMGGKYDCAHSGRNAGED